MVTVPDDFRHLPRHSIKISASKLLCGDSDNACEFDTGIGQRFLVTLHHGLERSNAGMLSLWVESVDDWQAYLKSLELDKKYPGVKVADPTITEWGWRILYVWDPGGYLCTSVNRPVKKTGRFLMELHGLIGNLVARSAPSPAKAEAKVSISDGTVSVGVCIWDPQGDRDEARTGSQHKYVHV